MEKPEQTPEPPPRQAAPVDASPLLIAVVVFGVLTLLGAGMLVSALMGRGGVLLGVVGGGQSVVCAAMLGALARRWRAAAREERLRRMRGERGEGQADAP